MNAADRRICFLFVIRFVMRMYVVSGYLSDDLTTMHLTRTHLAITHLAINSHATMKLLACPEDLSIKKEADKPENWTSFALPLQCRSEIFLNATIREPDNAECFANGKL
ncbi:hypothetical protein PSI17_15150 [Xenorhabdus sp. IM139775]|nr:hypothetical protein [Xenorhabdus sp. IM139775]